MAETLFAELKRYVGWSPEDEAALGALHPHVQGELVGITDRFYGRIHEHEEARRVLLAGETGAHRLAEMLQEWLDTLLRGPWDEAYYERRARIGRVHVRIGLPQHYMFGAMNVIRSELEQLAERGLSGDAKTRRAARGALGKILDLELGIMLHTYREDLLAQQARTERLSAYGHLVGSIGHELRNPLSVIQTSLFLLRGQAPAEPRVSKHLDRIAEQLQLANGVIDNLLGMMREEPLRREPLAPAAVVEHAAAAVARPPGLRLELQGLEALPEIEGDAAQLRQVVINLLENAVRAAPEDGWIRISGRAEPGSVELTVEDNGPGVDPELRARIFEPLVTGRPEGLGLGLSLVKRILERHGGGIRLDDSRGAGARFIACLPAPPERS